MRIVISFRFCKARGGFCLCGSSAEEIKGKKEQFSDYCVTTIFLGGGTPSILEGVYTASIFRALRESFDIAENAEITMEVNPGTVSEEKINMWKTCGVNRLSIGLQAVDDGELKMLGRIHTYDNFSLHGRW